MVPHADVESDTGKWVSALFQAAPGVNLLGVTEQLSWKEWLHMWGTRNQVETRYREASSDEYASKMEGFSEAVLEELKFVEQYGLTGGNPEVIFPEDVSPFLGLDSPFALLITPQIRRMGISLDDSKIMDQIRECDWSSIL